MSTSISCEECVVGLLCSCAHTYPSLLPQENMKDIIKFCMTYHEAEIRKLAETPLGTERFQLFIQRWEINNEPLPEESKTEKCVYFFFTITDIDVLSSDLRTTAGRRRVVYSMPRRKTTSTRRTTTTTTSHPSASSSGSEASRRRADLRRCQRSSENAVSAIRWAV